MRYIRYGFFAVVGVALLLMALANNTPVVLRLVPSAIEDVLGLDRALALPPLPLFLVVFLGIALGLVMGFLWEWLREHGLRSQKAQAERELQRLRRDLQKARQEAQHGAATPASTEPAAVLALLEKRE
ncbi:MAG: DUF1049 domain-containing protein [Rhodobacteraceae bacterium]|nr:DUF1049 domain-containing protein [Paracoccaceae bacterium]